MTSQPCARRRKAQLAIFGAHCSHGNVVGNESSGGEQRFVAAPTAEPLSVGTAALFPGS